MVAMAAISPSVSLGNGLMYQLPEDGAWAKYEISLTSRTGDQVELSGRGTLRMASVGQKSVDGKPCRWIQANLEIAFAEVDARFETVLNVLVPEKHLGKGKTPLSHVVVTSEGVQATIHENGERRRLNDPQAPNESPLPLILAPPLGERKALKAATIKNAKLGQIACGGESGTIELARGGTKGVVKMETRLAKQTPFGVVYASWRGSVEQTAETPSHEATWEFHLVDFGLEAPEHALDESPETPAPKVRPKAMITRGDAPAATDAEAKEDLLAICGPRATHVMDRPASKAASAELATGIRNHPELVQRCKQFAESIIESPDIAASLAAIGRELARRPPLKQLARDIMAEDGGDHADRIKNAILRRMERSLQGEAWKKCCDDALDKFTSRPLVNAAIQSLIETWRNRFLDTEYDFFPALAADPRLKARLTELNGGKTPTLNTSENLFLKHVATEERWETFTVQLLGAPLVKKELGEAFMVVLESDEFKAIVTSRLAKIMGDAQFQSLAVDLMDVWLRDNPTAAQFEGILQPLIALPVLNEATIGALHDVRKCEDLNEAFGKAFKSVLESDEFKKAIESAFLSDL